MKTPLIFGALLTLWPTCSNAQEQAQGIKFEVSCSPAAQAEFNRGIELLHSFEYPATIQIFEDLLRRHPDCQMARWGIAMSLWHPLWAPPSAAELERGARVLGGANMKVVTPREFAYLTAAKAYFSSTDINTHRDRSIAYTNAMERVFSSQRDDPEAATFYALALLATADPRDKSYSNQLKAAGILKGVGENRPEHPAVLHYTIHAYDYPGLALHALPAALIYARTAPDSAHAQHMPSHIFTRLGMWDRSLHSNHDSTRSAEEFTKRAALPGYYDEGIHSIDYLMYAMLQTARDDEAGRLLHKLDRIKNTDSDNFKVAFSYAAAPSRYAIERREWAEAAAMKLSHPSFPWSDFPWAEAIHHFAKGLGGVRSGDAALGEAQLNKLKSLQAKLEPSTLPYWREQVQVQIEILQSWILWTQGEEKPAIALARAAADREDAVDKHPVTPGEVVPARELLAEMLLLSGDHAGALSQYKAVLANSPNRLNALLGAARAAAQMGLEHEATTYRKQAAHQTQDRSSARKF